MAIRIPTMQTSQVSAVPSGRQAVPSMSQLMAIGGDGGIGTRLAEAAGDVAEKFRIKALNEAKADKAANIMQRVNGAEEKIRKQQGEFLGMNGVQTEGIEEKASAFADQVTKEAIDGVDDKYMRLAIIDQIGSRRASMLNNIAAHRRREREVVMKDTMNSRISGLTNDYVGTTSREEEQGILRNLSLTVQSMGAAMGQSPETINYNVAAQTSKAVSGKVISMVEKTPGRALAYYNQTKDMILPDDRAGLEHRIQGRIEHEEAKRKQAIAERRAELVGGVNDAYSYMMETGDASALQQIRTGFVSIGDRDRASKIDQTVKAGSMAYALTTKTESMPFAKRVEEITGAFQVTGVEGAGDVVQARQLAMKKVSQDMESFRKDPAGYVDQSIPQSATGASRLQARLERQRELGVGLDYKPELLSDVEKATFKNQWKDAKDGRAKLDMVNAINKQYGDFAPAILDELKVPAGAMAGAALSDMNAAADTDAALLVTAATSDRKDIPKADSMKAVDVQAAVEGSSVYGVKAKVARITGADAKMQEGVRSLENTLYNAVLITGNTKTANVLDGYIGALDDSDYMVTFDRRMVPDEGKLMTALDNKKQQFASQYGADVKEKAGIFSRFLGSAYQNNTVWIDSPDGNGWVLLNKTTQALVAGPDGEPLRTTIDEVNSAKPRGMESAVEMGEGVIQRPVSNRQNIQQPEPEIAAQAKSKYGFLAKHNVKTLVNPKKGEGYAETWPADEEGSPDWKRPEQLPMGTHGVEIKDPANFSPDDYAAEVFSHVDKTGIQAAKDLLGSMNKEQIEAMKGSANDYSMSKDMGMSEEDSLRNASMAVLRGYVFGQWPKEAIDELGFNAQQKQILEKAKKYAKTGKK